MKQNLKDGLATQGYDVVSFFNEKPSKGSESYTVTHNGGKYLFANQKNKDTFEDIGNTTLIPTSVIQSIKILN